MPNLRTKTWTTTTPAYVEDAQFWEDHLISDAVAAKAASSVQTVNSTAPDANGNVDVVALPAGGTVGQVLTKKSSTDGDADWENPASSGHTIKDEDGVSMTQQPTLQFLNADVTNDSVNSATVVDCKGAKGDAATIAVGTTTTLAAGSDATVTNSGTSSAAVFNFGIPKGADGADGADGSDGADGVSVTGVTLYSTSGRVKTYRMTFSDGTHFDYEVTDGENGSGAGDMLQSDYDPNQTVYNAGGIPDYVASQAYTLPTAASNVLGGVKVGTNLSIDASGVLSATDTNTDALHDLTDVNISLPSDGQALLYNNTSGKWENGDVAGSAADISYDNTSSGLTADDVQEAIDEVDSNVDTLSSTVTTLSGKVYKTDDSTETTIASDDLLPIYDTSATAAKKITVANVVKATVSNPNLLDNPWFTVNQRGQSSYTSVTSALTYNFDRWATWAGATGSITVASASQGVDVTVTSDAEDNQLTQRMNIDLTGKIITLSLDVNGIIYTATGEVPARTSSWQSITIDTGTGVRCNFNVAPIGESISCATTIRCGKNNTTYNIRAIKLEIGSVSTLAMDTAPNYATELLKCQRYFYGEFAHKYAILGYGYATSTTNIRIKVPLSVLLRTVPSITIDASLTYIFGNGTSNIPSAITVQGIDSNGVQLNVTVANAVLNELYILKLNNTSLALSADL